MHALRSMRNFLAGLGLAAFMIGFAPRPATALPHFPVTRNTYRLFARAVANMSVNRVIGGINSIGELCVDSTGGGTTEGCYWPRGTADNYIFNAGLQIAGVVGGTKSAANPWGGDTTGVWFFDGNGGRAEAEAVTPVFRASDAADVANWPAQALVPQGDAVASIYATALQGVVSASQGDAQFLAWDGNPAFNASRPHPLGILADYRVLAWNYPAGAQDVLFLVGTVYNVTSANCSDYAAQRPSMQTILCTQGAKFQQLNNAKFGITLPQGGYTITHAFMAAAEDDDVGTVNANFNGVILPFAMGYTYDGPFSSNIPAWKFDPTIFGPPFFTGSGFVGTKYLKGPDGPGAIQLMQTFCNGGPCGAGHSDPADMGVEYRLLAGTPAATDGQCNVTAPGLTPAQIHVCFMLLGATGADTRRLMSSTELTLAPGQSKTIVVAYIFAAPVQVPGFTPTTIQHDPGTVTWSNSTDSMFKYNGSGKPGLNLVDSLSGFLAYTGPHFNLDGSVHTPLQSEFTVVKGSLLGKALVAQAVFDAKFLQEFAPAAPQFFLIPGNKQVTVLWRPSSTETTGDPYFSTVNSPTVTNSAGQQVPNALYDPNYRQFDVEGYRIYRGRSDTPSALRLLIQFDYAGTSIKDFTGFVVNGNCAPEVGVLTDCPIAFPTPSNPTPPGTAATQSFSYNIGPQASGDPLMFVDQSAGTRFALAGGIKSIATVVDTVVSGGGSGFPPLADTGVPFIFIDAAGAVGCGACGVNNGVNYYYSVTAFDVNYQSGSPTSLESARVTKQVTPQAAAGNLSISSTTGNGVYGRGTTPLTDNVMPTLSATTGEFSKPFPPSSALTLAVAGQLPVQLLNGSGAASVQYDSTTLTQAGTASSTSVGIIDWFTGGTTKISVPISLSATTGNSTGAGAFPALTIDSVAAKIYGGGSGYAVPGAFTYTRLPAYSVGLPMRGCVNGAVAVPAGKAAGQCLFQGPRWFSGANESTPNPTTANPQVFTTGAIAAAAGFGNAGSLPGVVTIHHPDPYGYFTGSQYRDVDMLLTPFVTAADYKLYWGSGGNIDSVIDVTDNTVVPFNANINSSWGVLNPSAASGAGSYDGTATLTVTDFTCVPPLSSFALGSMPRCGTARYALARTAVPGPIGYCVGPVSSCKTPIAAANNGFGLYLKGRIFLVELTGGAVPAAGTVWSERDYVGSIFGGNAKDGNPATQYGSYAFSPDTPLPFTAPGASVKYTFNVTNQLVSVTGDILAKVHTVPDPYYVTSAFDIAVNNKDIQFVNVPTGATIRIYTSSGVLLRVLQNTTTTFGGIVHWNVRNRTNQFVASGVYFYNVEAGGISHTGRMTIVNYASTVQ